MQQGREQNQFAAKFSLKTLLVALANGFVEWSGEQIPLIECFFVALSLHVVMLPLIWFMGWALPWPKSPVITTIIEYDLGDFPNMAKPKKVFDVRDPELNK
jgi:hypothetical protein